MKHSELTVTAEIALELFDFKDHSKTTLHLPIYWITMIRPNDVAASSGRLQEPANWWGWHALCFHHQEFIFLLWESLSLLPLLAFFFFHFPFSHALHFQLKFHMLGSNLSALLELLDLPVTTLLLGDLLWTCKFSERHQTKTLGVCGPKIILHVLTRPEGLV